MAKKSISPFLQDISSSKNAIKILCIAPDIDQHYIGPLDTIQYFLETTILYRTFLIAIHDGVFSDTSKTIRVETTKSTAKQKVPTCLLHGLNREIATIQGSEFLQKFFKIDIRGFCFTETGASKPSVIEFTPLAMEIFQKFRATYFSGYKTAISIINISARASKTVISEPPYVLYNGEKYIVSPSSCSCPDIFLAKTIAAKEGITFHQAIAKIRGKYEYHKKETKTVQISKGQIVGVYRKRLWNLGEKWAGYVCGAPRPRRIRGRSVATTSRWKPDLDYCRWVLQQVVFHIECYRLAIELLNNTDKDGYYTDRYWQHPVYGRMFSIVPSLQTIPREFRKHFCPDYKELDMSGAVFKGQFHAVSEILGHEEAIKRFPNLYRCAKDIHGVRKEILDNLRKIDSTTTEDYVKIILTAVAHGANVTHLTKEQSRTLEDCGNSTEIHKASNLSFVSGEGYSTNKVPLAAYENPILVSLEKEQEEILHLLEAKYRKRIKGLTYFMDPYSSRVLPLSKAKTDGHRIRTRRGAKIAFIYQNFEARVLMALKEELDCPMALIHDGVMIPGEVADKIDIEQLARDVEKRLGITYPLLEYKVK